MKGHPILVRRGRTGALLPADAEAEEVLAKIPVGEMVEIQIRRGRSLPQHKLFRALLRYVAEASEWETDERLLDALKVELGKFDRVLLPTTRKVIAKPHSTSFAEMDQIEFAEFFENSVRLICEKVIPGTNRDDLIDEVQAMLGTSSSNEIASDTDPQDGPAVQPPPPSADAEFPPAHAEESETLSPAAEAANPNWYEDWWIRAAETGNWEYQPEGNPKPNIMRYDITKLIKVAPDRPNLEWFYSSNRDSPLAKEIVTLCKKRKAELSRALAPPE